MKPTILWFRHDLRLSDNPALVAAIERGGPIIPVFTCAPEEDGAWPPGPASRWWLHQSLARLQLNLRKKKSALALRKGPSIRALRALAAETGAAAVLWNRRYEPAAAARDARVEEALRSDGLEVATFNAGLLWEPWSVQTKAGAAYQVFTAFWNGCLRAGDPAAPSAGRSELARPRSWPGSLALADLALKPGMKREDECSWQPGEVGATLALQRFVESRLGDYPQERDRPDRPGTSLLSPHLHFGEIGPRQVWHAVRKHAASQLSPAGNQAAESFLREIAWREFAHHVLHHFPHTTEEPLRPKFAHFPWRDDPKALAAWKAGRTGYPIVDAGMRQLASTGWMHNRVRMIVASFLVKDLLIPWQAGARWFWRNLLDADLANNTLNWQWAAGCGADAAPYFRILNPVTQGEKFDPRGDFVRTWLPELHRLPAQWIHKPWMAPAAVLRSAGVKVGRTYPAPIVDHDFARRRALQALASIRSDSGR